MRKANLQRRCGHFLARVDRITDRARRFDQLRRLTDRRWAYEMLALNAVTAWDDFTEEIFYGALNRDSSALAKTLGLTLPKHLTLPLCEALFTSRGFLAFPNVDELKKAGKKFLGPRHPFAGIPGTTGQTIDRLVATRNLIAHGSRVARSRYHTKVLRAEGVRYFVEPGRFLMAKPSARTRLAIYLDALRAGGTAIYNAL
jgi:hypothetical protein